MQARKSLPGPPPPPHYHPHRLLAVSFSVSLSLPSSLCLCACVCVRAHTPIFRGSGEPAAVTAPQPEEDELQSDPEDVAHLNKAPGSIQSCVVCSSITHIRTHTAIRQPAVPAVPSPCAAPKSGLFQCVQMQLETVLVSISSSTSSK